MDPVGLEIEVHQEDGDIDLVAFHLGRRVGYAHTSRDGERLQLDDIHVEAQFSRPWPLAPALLNAVLGRRRPERLRGRGIGTALMTRLLAEADRAGVREVWGSVTADDLRATPRLLDWYARFGFTASDADGECMSGAVRKVARRAPSAGVTARRNSTGP